MVVFGGILSIGRTWRCSEETPAQVSCNKVNHGSCDVSRIYYRFPSQDYGSMALSLKLTVSILGGLKRVASDCRWGKKNR